MFCEMKVEISTFQGEIIPFHCLHKNVTISIDFGAVGDHLTNRYTSATFFFYLFTY
jgi:hypothetical protein